LAALRDAILVADLPPEVVAELQAEALALRAGAERAIEPHHSIDVDGGVHGVYSAYVAGPGPALHRFQHTVGLKLAMALSKSDEPIFPTRSTYLYYGEGDHGLLHHDVITATITVIVGLNGKLNPLVFYPSLGAVTSQDLSVLNGIRLKDRNGFESEGRSHFGPRLDGIEVPFASGKGLAIRGRHIAHARYAQSSAATVCAACFAHLIPSVEWVNKSI
jgi:hypothetical protein